MLSSRDVQPNWDGRPHYHFLFQPIFPVAEHREAGLQGMQALPEVASISSLIFGGALEVVLF
jgi:hypothetical protein